MLFTANWCGPCKSVKRVIEESNIEVDIMDVDIHPDLCKAHAVLTVPTLVLENGTLITTANEIIDYLS